MSFPVVLAAVAAALLLGGKKSAPRGSVEVIAPKPRTPAQAAAEREAREAQGEGSEALAERIVKESKEILQGERDAYSPTPEQLAPAHVQPPAVQKEMAARPAPAMDEALLAAQLAERQGGAPNSSQAATVSNNVVATVPDKTAPLPKGYDSAAASARAQPMADHVRTRKGKYDRAVLASWQTQAGLKPDGLYGPQSVAALKYYGAKNVPAALFKGSQTKYAPPAGG